LDRVLIGTWFNKNKGFKNEINYIIDLENYPCYHYPHHSNQALSSCTCELGYTEITLDFFKKYILNE